MADLPDYFPKGADPVAVRAEWLAAAEALVAGVEDWCRGTDWATRRETKRVEDPPLEPYDAPMLLMQYWDTKLLLEPSSRFGYGDDGQYDFYLMPIYDDMAKVVRKSGQWFLREFVRHGSVQVPFTKESFTRLVDDYRNRHARAG
jgi:hypothetical protein